MIQLQREDLNNEQQELIDTDRDQIEPSEPFKKKSSFSLFWADLRKYKKDVSSVLFIYLLLTGSCYDLVFGLTTYLGAKEMSNISGVKETKKWVSRGLIGKLTFASFLSYFVPNKRRKLVLEFVHTIGLGGPNAWNQSQLQPRKSLHRQNLRFLVLRDLSCLVSHLFALPERQFSG